MSISRLPPMATPSKPESAGYAIKEHAEMNPIDMAMGSEELDRVVAVLRSAHVLWKGQIFYMTWDTLSNIAGVPRESVNASIRTLLDIDLVEIVQYGSRSSNDLALVGIG